MQAKITLRRSGSRVGLAEGIEQVVEVVAAEVAKRAVQLGVVELGNQLLDLSTAAAVFGSAAAQLLGTAPQQSLVPSLGIWSIRR
ncbi:MAG: hypothetical protein U0R26_10970 [Solirubrobacterales bacterium]